ncbi:MAG: ABC transporter substrate-binding protein [Gammaproteobacteria bacterium]|nr:ABC transporter substrate-binding protein [Gammaproteobacteria bacterium]
MKTLQVLLAALLLMPAFGQAETALGPGEAVKATSEKMLEVLRTNRELLDKQPEKIIDLVEEIVVPQFDFVRISAWVLGKHWRRASPEQRGVFVTEFQSLMVNTYATALLEYSDYKISYTPVRMAEGDRIVTVRTNVERAGADAINLDYRLIDGKQGWKVFDILVDNVSLVANYRTSFDQEIRETSMDALNERLARHNAKREKGEG